MRRLIVLTMVSTLIVGTAGCRACNWFGRSSDAAVMPAYGGPAFPAAPYAIPGTTTPATSSAPCGPGCNSCGTTPPILSGAQDYAPTPGI